MISTLNSWAIGRNDHDKDEGDNDEQEAERHDGDGNAARDRLGQKKLNDRVQTDGDEQRHSYDDQGAGDLRQATKEEVGDADSECPC